MTYNPAAIITPFLLVNITSYKIYSNKQTYSINSCVFGLDIAVTSSGLLINPLVPFVRGGKTYIYKFFWWNP